MSFWQSKESIERWRERKSLRESVRVFERERKRVRERERAKEG